jgi:predicted AAA+ superfamily ATPase
MPFLSIFQKFMRACAARTGQLLNKASISEDLGISPSTVNEWLSLLASSYIIFLLEPYYEKYGKRLVKTPKLYFVDTGIACHLLGLRDAEEVSLSYLRGSIIETCIISDLYKQFLNLDKDPDLYFWRDQTGHEVDVIVDRKPHPIAIEIKSSKTISPEYFDNVLFWNKITKSSNSGNYIIYGGPDSQQWPHASVVSWQSSGDLIKKEFEKRVIDFKG